MKNIMVHKERILTNSIRHKNLYKPLFVHFVLLRRVKI